MSPAGQCMVIKGEDEEQHRDFFTRVLELPSLQHAISLYNHTKVILRVQFFYEHLNDRGFLIMY